MRVLYLVEKSVRHGHLAGLGFHLSAEYVDGHRHDNHQADYDILDIVARAEQVQAVADGGNQQSAQQRTPPQMVPLPPRKDAPPIMQAATASVS